MLRNHQIPRCYFPKEANTISIQLHGFSDTSELAYAETVYLRVEKSNNNVHTSLVMAKTRVALIKCLTIPRLQHISNTLNIAPEDIYAWTDSLVVLSWLQGNPRRFKTFVGNRV